MRTITAHFPASGVTVVCRYGREPGLGSVEWEGEAVDAFLARAWPGARERFAQMEGARFRTWAHGMAGHLGEPVELTVEGDAEFTPEDSWE